MNKIITNRVQITKSNVISHLYMTSDTGKIIYRDKIDTIIGIKHPGIVLGKDQWGTVWVIHNHYQYGCAVIVSWQDFAEDTTVFFDDREVFYSPLEIVERAITYYLSKKEYGWLTSNCQHFVNTVTRNENTSEAIEEVSDKALLIGGVMALVGLAFDNKALLLTGAGIATAGGVGKAVNRS